VCWAVRIYRPALRIVGPRRSLGAIGVVAEPSELPLGMMVNGREETSREGRAVMREGRALPYRNDWCEVE
jgi:hypothetical protein